MPLGPVLSCTARLRGCETPPSPAMIVATCGLHILEPFDQGCVVLRVEYDCGQPPTLRHVQRVLGLPQRIELLAETGSEISGCYDPRHLRWTL